jgi:predicted membrane channel-forming protein YqfA (hemolysin III family)
MHENARAAIEGGLSRGARITLVLFAGLFGVAMILIAPPDSDSKRWFFYVFGAFCLAIAIACVTRGRVRQFAGSLIGSAIFLAGVAYLVDALLHGTLWSLRGSDPRAYDAIKYLLAIGIPGAWYAIRTRFGFRK